MQQLPPRNLLLPMDPRGGKKTGETPRTHFSKRTSSGCCAPIEDVPKSSTGKSKKSRAAPPETKKVPVKEDGRGSFYHKLHR